HPAIEGTALGMIDWFDNTKGYGIVQSPMFGAVFVHIRSFPERPTAPLQRYQIISFRVEAEGNDGRLRARSSRLLEHPKSFTVLMSLLDQECKVTIDKESRCLLTYGTVQLFADQAEH
ncbi:cold shock domain-containing protein, partial [Sphingobacterium hotanense]|uniref:cold shock domain-containing protein n=1 Tax=Sphingobacterium hotanense TaxID=649196 RepID=UPI0021A35703